MAKIVLQSLCSGFKKRVTSISFRILFFNIILIIITTILFLNLDSYERVLLHELGLNQGSIGRSVSGNLAWKGELTQKNVHNLVNGMMLMGENRVQIFNKDREQVYDTGIDRWETGPDINEYRDRLVYRAALFIYDLFTLSYQQSPLYTADPDYHLTGNDWRKLNNGRGFSMIKRDISKDIPIVFYSVFPIKERQKIKGAVIISRSVNRILNAIYKIRYLVINFFLITMMVTIILNLIISKTILKPINKLISHIGKISDNDHDIDFQFTSLPGNDEISQLSRSFSGMTQKLKNEIILNRNFIDEMVHEIKNPLTSVRSAAEMADMAESKDDQKMFHNIIANDVSRMENLLSGIKELSRINTSRTEKPPIAIDLALLTEKLVENINIQTDKCIKINYNEDLEYLAAIDETRYLQVIENIIRNAMDFSPQNGSIKVALNINEQFIFIKISDGGPGIPDIHLPHVFERFYSKRPEKKACKHTGIGLSIAKSIIRNAGGDICVANQKNRGACFTIQLAAVEQ